MGPAQARASQQHHHQADGKPRSGQIQCTCYHGNRPLMWKCASTSLLKGMAIASSKAAIPQTTNTRLRRPDKRTR